jgi:hypothetical protein
MPPWTTTVLSGPDPNTCKQRPEISRTSLGPERRKEHPQNARQHIDVNLELLLEGRIPDLAFQCPAHAGLQSVIKDFLFHHFKLDQILIISSVLLAKLLVSHLNFFIRSILRYTENAVRVLSPERRLAFRFLLPKSSEAKLSSACTKNATYSWPPATIRKSKLACNACTVSSCIFLTFLMHTQDHQNEIGYHLKSLCGLGRNHGGSTKTHLWHRNPMPKRRNGAWWPPCFFPTRFQARIHQPVRGVERWLSWY